MHDALWQVADKDGKIRTAGTQQQYASDFVSFAFDFVSFVLMARVLQVNESGRQKQRSTQKCDTTRRLQDLNLRASRQ